MTSWARALRGRTICWGPAIFGRCFRGRCASSTSACRSWRSREPSHGALRARCARRRAGAPQPCDGRVVGPGCPGGGARRGGCVEGRAARRRTRSGRVGIAVTPHLAVGRSAGTRVCGPRAHLLAPAAVVARRRRDISRGAVCGPARPAARCRLFPRPPARALRARVAARLPRACRHRCPAHAVGPGRRLRRPAAMVARLGRAGVVSRPARSRLSGPVGSAAELGAQHGRRGESGRRLVSTFLSPLATSYVLVVVLLYLVARRPNRGRSQRPRSPMPDCCGHTRVPRTSPLPSGSSSWPRRSDAGCRSDWPSPRS